MSLLPHCIDFTVSTSLYRCLASPASAVGASRPARDLPAHDPDRRVPDRPAGPRSGPSSRRKHAKRSVWSPQLTP